MKSKGQQIERTPRSIPGLGVFMIAMGCTLSACAYIETSYPEKIHKNAPAVFRAPGEDLQQDSVLGTEGLTLFSSFRKRKPESTGLGVNSFLWRAALDTTAFMPMSSADPFGGVIITDWYTPPENPQERFKMNVYIFSRELRSDGLKVSAFRQVMQPNGKWQSAFLHANTELENAILTRARQLRMTCAQ